VAFVHFGAKKNHHRGHRDKLTEITEEEMQTVFSSLWDLWAFLCAAQGEFLRGARRKADSSLRSG
jgi:uncharacterized membrane protein